MSRFLTLCATVALALSGSGCTAFELSPPDTFVRLRDADQEREGYALRAVSTEGLVMGVQVIDHDLEGTLTFWTDAIRRRVRDQGGYALLSEEEIRAASGEDGRLLRFGRDLSGRAYRYTLAVYVTDASIFVAEAGGPADAYEAQAAEVEASLLGIELR